MPTKPALNRRSEVRSDLHKIQKFLASSRSKIFLSHKGKFVCTDKKIHYFDYTELVDRENEGAQRLISENEISHAIYLGELDNVHFFLVQIDKIHKRLESKQFLDLRTAAYFAESFDRSSMFYAQGLINWHFEHTFCAKCGSKTLTVQSGHCRQCTNAECKKEHFPRIEPAVICSIETEIDGIKKTRIRSGA